jgi:ATP-binding cassette subfamily G (WHITE) protein 2 (SNQ2)
MFAAFLNPLIVVAGMLSFCGVVIPYDAITVFWRSWMYWLDPFNYLMGGLLTQLFWEVPVHCSQDELSTIPLPENQTCGDYLASFLSVQGGYVVDPTSTSSCQYCAYSVGADYAKTFNLRKKYYGWRDVRSIPSIFELDISTDMKADWYYGFVLHCDLWSCIPDDENEE